MRNKASLSLMEQLVMILVFSLAAALCLGVFARADQISKTTQHRETAAQIAQNGAELLKSGAKWESLPLPEGYTAQLQMVDGNIRGLQMAEIQVSYGPEMVFALQTAWQEDLP